MKPKQNHCYGLTPQIQKGAKTSNSGVERNVIRYNLQTTCESMSAGLAEVYSADVNDVLKTMIKATGYTVKDRYTWLGLNDLAKEGTFVWDSSGKTPSFTDWKPGEPNNLGDEDCVRLFVHDFAKWNDAPCHLKSRFVCQLR